MKKQLALMSLLLCSNSFNSFSNDNQSVTLPYWQDIQTVSVNRMEPRSAFMSYADKSQAMSGKYESSPYYKLLNGVWKFYYTDSHRNLPADITEKNTDVSGWNDIKVPGNWEMQGYGVAIYTNHGYSNQETRSLPNCRMIYL